MPSSWKIWDLLKNKPHILDSKSPRLVFIQSFSPFALRIIKENIPDELFSENKLFIKLGKEITQEWVDENFKTMSLFGNSESFLILNAHEMNEKVKEAFKKPEELFLDNRFVILDYNKDDSFLKKMQKNEAAEVLKITAPAFWEKEKLLDFLGKHLSIFLTYDAREYFLKHVEFSIEEYFNYLSQLKINFQEKDQVDLDDLNTVVYKHSWDQFELSELFATRRFKAFYSRFCETQNFEDIRMVAQFLQSHLVKVFDPSYTQKKSKLTKYDRDILKQHEIWSPAELHKAIHYFVSVEHKAKSKDSTLFNQLKRDAVRASF